MRRRILLNSGGIDPTTGRGTIGGYEVVDLGLPSGLLWATCNVGANTETSYGNYYMYGKGSRTYNSGDTSYQGEERPLASSADTATQVMGSGWRMPMLDEFQELTGNTDYKWVTDFNGSGINGGKFTSKTNPNAYVFFPAAGYYNITLSGKDGGDVWSSIISYYNSSHAYTLFFNKYGKYASNSTSLERNHGLSVRGVHAAV